MAESLTSVAFDEDGFYVWQIEIHGTGFGKYAWPVGSRYESLADAWSRFQLEKRQSITLEGAIFSRERFA